ncbi:MAG TPA: endonuclease/exonuclease/phosphatase family protein [Nannocystis exedens]|nr:endonuclease/exonuclease/phosphatase family protein [Nannocystis exedens]
MLDGKCLRCGDSAIRRPMAILFVAALLAPGCSFWGKPTDSSGSESDSNSGSSSTSTAGDPEHISIATFNVRLFFDTQCNSGKCNDDDFETVASASGFEARADEIASAIRTIDADIILLQEIENQPCIDALASRLPSYSSVHLGEQGYPASLDTAVLSTLPTLEVISHLDETFPHPEGGTTSFTRDLLEMHFEVGGARVIVFDAHFRSKVFDDPGRRLAEGQRAGEWLALRAQEYPDALIVLGGDLNDTPGSPPLLALESATPVSRVAAELDDDATYIYSGNAQAIDHLYLATTDAGEHLQNSTVLFRITKNSGWSGFGGSDHAALRANFAVRP